MIQLMYLGTSRRPFHGNSKRMVSHATRISGAGIDTMGKRCPPLCAPIEASSSLMPGSFIPVITNAPATPPFNTHTGRVDSADSVFYRIRVETP